MNSEELQKEYGRFRDECIKLTSEKNELSRQNTKLESLNERLLKIIENLSETD